MRWRRARPGPGPVTVEAESAAGRGDAGGDVEQPVSDRLGCGASELAGAADRLGPGEQVVGGEAELHPDVVVDDVVERQVREARCFGVADDVLGASTLALTAARARRCRSRAVLVMNAVCRNPSMVSNNDNWAPGCGRSRRTINRVPSGQASRLTNSVSSTTSAPSRRVPSASTAGCQHPVGTHMTPSRTR